MDFAAGSHMGFAAADCHKDYLAVGFLAVGYHRMDYPVVVGFQTDFADCYFRMDSVAVADFQNSAVHRIGIEVAALCDC